MPTTIQDQIDTNILDRTIQYSETVDLFGELFCHTIYCWYDQPLIYDLSNYRYRFLCYLIDDEVYLFFSMTIKEQIDLENKNIDMKDFFKQNKTIYKVSYTINGTIIEKVVAALISDDCIPDSGVFINLDSV